MSDDDGDGSGDRPLGGVTVRVAGPGLNTSTVTGSAGGFSFDNLSAGSYSVSVTLPSGFVPIGGSSRTVTLDGVSAARADFLAARTQPATANPSAPTATPGPRAAPGLPAAPSATTRTLPTPAPAPGSVASQAAVARARQGQRSVIGPLVSSATRYYPGRAVPTMNRVLQRDGVAWLGVPFLSQLDGSAYGSVNCGPASAAMVLGTFGIKVNPAAIRDYVNSLSGVYNLAAGTSLSHLARIVQESGLEVHNLYGPGGGYRRWSTQELREEILAGRPVVTLVKYRALPSHGGSVTEFDHYIVIAGVSGNDFIYNDAIYTTASAGYGLVISPRDLERAWDYSSIPRHSMSVSVGAAARARLEAAARESEQPEDDDSLGEEVALGESLESVLGVDDLTFKRVMIDGLTDAEHLLEPGFELAEFLGENARRPGDEDQAGESASTATEPTSRERAPTPASELFRQPLLPIPLLVAVVFTAGVLALALIWRRISD